MAVSSPRRSLLAAVFFCFLLGAATSIRTAKFSSSQSLAEDKSRLGSTPPSCHNRCSACNPCTPVQVTTVPGLGPSARVNQDTVAAFSRYSNYKPLGWKCRCDGRLYDP
ncbi:unnamed protein product [Urochloa humidicola]